MGSQIIRTVKGNDYLYYAYYNEKKKRIETYCGLASSSSAKKKALECEREELVQKKNIISSQILKIDSKLKSLK